MPFYFSSSDSQYIIYMGKDKYENEHLIRWGWPEDLFFHVDDLSSAHIYLRTPYTYDMEKLKSADYILKLHPIPEAVIQECIQLCKANSIEGHKKAQVDMIITPWLNLNKSIDMDIGTIGFLNEKLVLKLKNVASDKTLARKVMKTKIVKDLGHGGKRIYAGPDKEEGKGSEKEKYNKPSKTPIEVIDLEKERYDRDEKEHFKKKQETKEKKQHMKKVKEEEKEQQKERDKERQRKSYDRMFEDESMATSNKNFHISAQEYEDTFM